MISTDTGGTFTDIAVFDQETHTVAYGKSLTNYGDLIDGALTALKDTSTPLDDTLLFKHGTTHVINTLLERTGAKTALVTTRGFRDSLEIGRGNRPVPFALEYRREPPLIERRHRHEVSERMGFDGQVLVPLAEDEIRQVAAELKASGIEAVAVSFINAYVNPQHEEQAARLLRTLLPDAYITCGSRLTREWQEYERTSTAAANAYVGGQMSSYIDTFDEKLRRQGFRGKLFMMGSNGGVLSRARATEQPIALVESGPIGGCIGAAAYARKLDLPQVIAFDMGGTTAKCTLVQDGVFNIHPVYYINGYDHGFPVKTPVLDIVEVGAGGGSIACVDDTGRLTVGPRSAGSEPGPAAFGRGGKEPTVTDANLVLGRISAGSFLNGKLRLDKLAATQAIRDLVAAPLGYEGQAGIDKAAQGILDLAATAMVSAIREITIERGFNAREFAFMAFGGGGPLFACDLARRLGISKVIIPPHPGNFSTLGMLMAGARIDLSRMVLMPARDDSLDSVRSAFEHLEVEARAIMLTELDMSDVHIDCGLEMRYVGQKHTVRVAWNTADTVEQLRERFFVNYKKRYGYVNTANPLEILEARLEAEAALPRPDLKQLGLGTAMDKPQAKDPRLVYFPGHGRLLTPVWQRSSLGAGFRITGPAIIEEFSSTTVLAPGDEGVVGHLGEVTITCDESTS